MWARLWTTSAPLRTPLQSPPWLLRCPPVIRPRPSSPRCRSLHLYLTARAKTNLGMHKVIAFSRYETPGLHMSQHRVNIVKTSSDRDGNEKGARTVVAEGITLEQVYNEYISPGKMIRLVAPIPRKAVHAGLEETERARTAQKYNDYEIFEPPSSNAPIGKEAVKMKPAWSKELKHLASLRVIPLRVDTPAHHFKNMIIMAWRAIQASCPVEIRIMALKTPKNKVERNQPAPSTLLDHIFNHYPHLRPDFILKSMPEGTKYLVEPFSNGRIMQFVLGSNTASDKFKAKNLTERVEMVKRRVNNSIEAGTSMQLPKAMRRQRIEQGDQNYSLESGLVRAALPPDTQFVVEKGSGPGKGQVVRWGAESLESTGERKKSHGMFKHEQKMRIREQHSRKELNREEKERERALKNLAAPVQGK